jgi:hypothetical protein
VSSPLKGPTRSKSAEHAGVKSPLQFIQLHRIR